METDPNEAVRQQEDKNDPAFDSENDPAPAGVDGELAVEPQPGGYAGRDPKTEMPVMPSVPETHDNPGAHDAAPDLKERDSHK